MATEKYRHLFDTGPLRADLKGRSVRGGAFSLAGETLSFVLRIASTAILARLLMPAEFGLVGMVTALTGFAHIFKDLGLSDATIQNPDVGHDKVSALFWINAAVGLALMLAVAGASPLISAFYREPRLTGIALALSSCFVFSGLTVQHQALLYRQMRFGQMAVVNVAANALSLGVGIGFALAGAGYWALAAKEISLTAFRAAGVWLATGWVPGRPRRTAGVSPLLKFGRDVTGFNVINYFARNMDNLLIGRRWGPAPLGLYDRAYQLMLMPLSQLRTPTTRVGMSGLSALQGDSARYSGYYSKLLSVLCFLYMPIVVYLGVYSRPVIRLVLGDQWTGAADIFRILALAGFIQPAAGTADLVLVSRGETRRYFHLGLASAVTIVLAIVIGVRRGPVGVATAYAAANYVLFLPVLMLSFKGSPVRLAAFFRSVAGPASASLAMGAILLLAAGRITRLDLIPSILVSAALGSVSYGAAWLIIPGGKKRLAEYFSYARGLMGLEPASRGTP
jgi:O-antigen/teichoic acid export membrane protein